MPGPHTGAPVQLLVYRFAPEAQFDGKLVGALERLEADGSIRVVDSLFVRSNAETGNPEVLAVGGDGIGSLLVPLLDFRLDENERRRVSEKAVAEGADGVPGEQFRELIASLSPGAALAAVLVEHVWTRTLDAAIDRTGGVPILSRFVGADALADVMADIEDAARRD